MLHRHAQYSGAETRRQFERAHRDDPWAVERKPFPFWSLTWRAALCVAIVWGFSVLMLAGGPA